MGQHDSQPTGQETKRFSLVPFHEVRLGKRSPYLVRGLVPRRGLLVIYGPAKSGKSFFTTDLFLHVALGWPYRRRRVQSGPVVYVSLEGHDGLPARVEAFRRHWGERLPKEFPFYLVAATMDLVAHHRHLMVAIHEELGINNPAAIVIDTLNRSLPGSESRDEDMAKYLGAASALIEEFGCCVAVVHHTGRDDSHPRGHTSLTAAADAQVSVKRNVDITATVEWMKDGPDGDRLASRLETVDVGLDEDGEVISSCVVVAIQPGEARCKPGVRISRPMTIALRALEDALAAVGMSPPQALPHLSPGIRVVLESEWRTRAYRLGISGGEERAKQKAFKLAVDGLVAAGLVSAAGGYAWQAPGEANP